MNCVPFGALHESCAIWHTSGMPSHFYQVEQTSYRPMFNVIRSGCMGIQSGLERFRCWSVSTAGKIPTICATLIVGAFNAVTAAPTLILKILTLETRYD